MEPEHFYFSRLGLRTFDVAGIPARVEKQGLSYHPLERVRKAVGLPAKRFCELVSISPRTLARRKEAGRLRTDESDRLLRLTRIVGLALRLFEGDLDNTRRWLTAPQVALGGGRSARLRDDRHRDPRGGTSDRTHRARSLLGPSS